MIECCNCGEEFYGEDVDYGCPYCGEIDSGDGYCECLNCGTLLDFNGDEWVCEYCRNEGIKRCPRQVYAEDDDECYYDDEYCEDGIPDVNQGWVGEHYG